MGARNTPWLPLLEQKVLTITEASLQPNTACNRQIMIEIWIPGESIRGDSAHCWSLDVVEEGLAMVCHANQARLTA